MHTFLKNIQIFPTKMYQTGYYNHKARACQVGSCLTRGVEQSHITDASITRPKEFCDCPKLLVKYVHSPRPSVESLTTPWQQQSRSHSG